GSVGVEPQRMYPTSRFAAHLLGYVREANEEQLRQGRYRRGDMVGQSGLERLLDQYLRGTDGGERIEVDALGRPIRLIQHTEPVPGAQVVTTIDRRIQEAAERAMQGHAGAVIVLDPRDGDVLAMVSTPAFALDQFTGTIDRDAWVPLIRNRAHPMLNRTGQSQYAPGPGFIPVSRRGRRPTFLGDTVNMAIGQGAVLATPMQVGRMMAAVTNGGIFFKPRLVQRVVRADGHVLYSDPGRVNGHVELSPMV